MVMAIHLPEPVRPAPDAGAGSHERIVEILDVGPDLRAKARNAVRACIPADRSCLAGSLVALAPGLFHPLAALFVSGLAVTCDGGLHRLDQRRKRGFGVTSHADVDGLEALEVLVVGFLIELDRADGDELGAGLDPRLANAETVILAVVDKEIHRVPEIGDLEPQDQVGLAYEHLRPR